MRPAAALLALLAATASATRTAQARLRAPDAAAAGAEEMPHKGPEFNYTEYDENWGEEYEAGHYPRWEQTKSDTWRYDDTKAYRDEQSDGKPSPGLTGDKVGAYLPADLPREMGHGP
ncbi:unnamed protein product [Prorocentrum cordatum]|uniref:Uncharacterized protein n=1 Tax=Prorocentrum cordatum TaxID=2364126 RepID=A0ABN9RBF4_9DINO|nr:unnamed protein product [Polarella glacialis]|mmetsp:Transcript_97829/g.265638  ORF Transcript_97829/g.265638 Transcript_97829/m.265638 type:complete len:117 (+) Transcript_97829:83-433(+)